MGISGRPVRPSCPAVQLPPSSRWLTLCTRSVRRPTSAYASGAQSRPRCGPKWAPTETTQEPDVPSGCAFSARTPGEKAHPEWLSGSSDVSVGGSFASFASRAGGRVLSVAARGGEDLVPEHSPGSGEDPPQPRPAGRSPGARSRPPTSASATTGTRPARGSRPGRTWRTHQPSPSGAECSRPSVPSLASRCLVSGAGPVSGPASPHPPPGGAGVADFQAITITQTQRPSVGGLRPGLVVMAWRSGRRRKQTPTEPTEEPVIPSKGSPLPSVWVRRGESLSGVEGFGAGGGTSDRLWGPWTLHQTSAVPARCPQSRVGVRGLSQVTRSDHPWIINHTPRRRALNRCGG